MDSATLSWGNPTGVVAPIRRRTVQTESSVTPRMGSVPVGCARTTSANPRSRRARNSTAGKSWEPLIIRATATMTVRTMPTVARWRGSATRAGRRTPKRIVRMVSTARRTTNARPTLVRTGSARRKRIRVCRRTKRTSRATTNIATRIRSAKVDSATLSWGNPTGVVAPIRRRTVETESFATTTMDNARVVCAHITSANPRFLHARNSTAGRN